MTITNHKETTMTATPIAEAIRLLAARGVEAKTQTYADGECSCCYFPDWETDGPRVMIPTNVAENQGDWKGAVECGDCDGSGEIYDFDEETDEDYHETCWSCGGDGYTGDDDPDANLLILDGEVVRPTLVGFEGTDDTPTVEVGRIAADVFAQVGLTVDWDGNPARRIEVSA